MSTEAVTWPEVVPSVDANLVIGLTPVLRTGA